MRRMRWMMAWISVKQQYKKVKSTMTKYSHYSGAIFEHRKVHVTSGKIRILNVKPKKNTI